MTGPGEVGRPPRVAVIGAAEASEEERSLAEELGGALAERGAVVFCGGRGGVMEACARGAALAGGLTIGILPGTDGDRANPWIRIPIPTGLGNARNALVVGAAHAAISVGGSWGTISEIALAKKQGIPVAALGRPPVSGVEIRRFDSAAEAADWAVAFCG